MKRVSAVFLGAMMVLAASAAGVSPVSAEPGPNGNNEHGLCTAYFNGQKNGHDKHGSPGSFAALEDDAEDDGSNEDKENETQISDDVFEFCDDFGIGGNPEENGRFDCREEDGTPRDEDGDGEIECEPND